MNIFPYRKFKIKLALCIKIYMYGNRYLPDTEYMY